MALKVYWTPRAKKGYDKIIEYLSKRWTEREVTNFVQETFNFLEQLSIYPELLVKSSKKNIYRGPINKYTIITYRLKPQSGEIQILNIRGSRQKPSGTLT